MNIMINIPFADPEYNHQITKPKSITNNFQSQPHPSFSLLRESIPCFLLQAKQMLSISGIMEVSHIAHILDIPALNQSSRYLI